MRASEWEFRYRFWIIAALFFIASGFAHRAPAFRLAAERIGWWGAASITLLFLFLAAAVRTWAAAYLNPEIIHSKRIHAEQLVADGPYRRVRNPLYLGTIFLAAGFGLFFAPLAFLGLVVAMVVFTLRLIGREESQLTSSQGESYREYLRRVPRLLPALAPQVPAGPAVPNWSKAFRGELMFWLFFADAAVFFAAPPLNHWSRVPLLEIGIVVAIAVHLLVQPRTRLRARAV